MFLPLWTLYSILLLHISVLSQEHALFITVAVYYCLKSEHYASSFVLFLQDCLAIPGLLLLHVNFRIVCSSSAKNVTDNLRGITLNL